MSSSQREPHEARPRPAVVPERRPGAFVRARSRAAAAVLAVAGALVVGTLVTLAALPTPAEQQAARDSQPGERDNPCPQADVQLREQPAARPAPQPSASGDRVWTGTIRTSCGTLTVQLDGTKAPQSVAVLTSLARSGFYDGTDCHRLTASDLYVLQCGDPTGTGRGHAGYLWGPIENAPADSTTYPSGTIAMARNPNQADSQGSQFFIVYRDSRIPPDAAGGYSVVGRVTRGLDVVQKVAQGGTTDEERPVRSISIEGVTLT